MWTNFHAKQLRSLTMILVYTRAQNKWTYFSYSISWIKMFIFCSNVFRRSMWWQWNVYWTYWMYVFVFVSLVITSNMWLIITPALLWYYHLFCVEWIMSNNGNACMCAITLSLATNWYPNTNMNKNAQTRWYQNV